MVKQYKSVLEKHNESLKPRRLPTPEEQAIEPVYPEEYLIGGPGKAVASGFRSSAEKAAAKEAARYRIAQTKIGERALDINEVKEQLKNTAALKNNKMYKDLVRDEEAKQSKQFALQRLKNLTKKSSDRSQKNFFGEAGTHIGGAMADENRNAAGDTYKKGGKVSASSRGDGVAQRGKTKGRLV